MTAPAQPRTPTPGDLARRPTAKPTPAAKKPATVEESIAPGELKPGEIMRQLYQQAMRISRMKPHTRLLALTLVGYANHKNGRLTYEPTVAQLSYATGLSDGQVKTHLQILTQRGWLTRSRPRSGPRKDRLVGQVCIPALVLTQLRTRKAHADD